MSKQKVNLNTSIDKSKLRNSVLIESAILSIEDLSNSFLDKAESRRVKTIKHRFFHKQKQPTLETRSVEPNNILSSIEIAKSNNAKTIESISVGQQDNWKTNNIEKSTDIKPVKLRNAIELLNNFISSFKSYSSHINSLKVINHPIIETYASDSDLINEFREIKSSSDFMSRDAGENDDSILIGPQDAIDVKFTKNNWPNVHNVKEALDSLQAWSTSISADAQQIKTNIENALSAIEDFEPTPIESTDKVSVLRERVNDLQEVLQTLYNSFS